MGRDAEAFTDPASVESCDKGPDDVALTQREFVGAAKEIKRLPGRRASERDDDLPIAVTLETCSLDHHPPAVDSTVERVDPS